MNRKIYTTMVQIAMVVLVFFLNPFLSNATATDDNGINNPDFAYPKTVIDNAEVHLENALQSSDSMDIIKAVLQIVIAKNQISQGNATEMIQLIDSIASTQCTEIRAILYSIEAELYFSIYSSGKYDFDRRNISLDNIPSSPHEWDKNLFALKINELVSKSLSEKHILFNSPISEYEEILEPLTDESKIFYPSLYDFIAYRAMSMLQAFESRGVTIPFFDVERADSPLICCQKNISGILSSLKQEYWQKGEIAPYVLAVINSLIEVKDSKEYENMLKSEYEKLKDYDYSIELLIKLIEGETEKARIFGLCHELKHELKRFPHYVRHKVAENLISRIESPFISISYKKRIYPDTRIRVTGNAENINCLYLHLYKLYDYNSKTIGDVINNGSLVETIAVKSDIAKPFISEIDTAFNGLGVGYYCILPATGPAKEDLLYKETDHLNDIICVTRLYGFLTIDNEDSSSGRVYVTNLQSGIPRENVYVEIGQVFGKKKFNEGTTNDAGYVELGSYDFSNYEIGLTDGDDCYNFNAVMHDRQTSGVISYASVFTDLAIYHPGDTVRFSIIAYDKYQQKNELCKNRKLMVSLYDANYEIRDTLKLTTDSYGRANGEFVLPVSGLRGVFSINVTNRQGGTSIRVEEYNPPTFYVELNDIENNYNVGDTICISGTVKTYSGMPVENANISFKIDRRVFRSSYSDCSYSGKASTDSDGIFSIELPTKNLSEQKYIFCSYLLSISATSAAGESVESAQRLFCIGEGYQIDISGLPNRTFVHDDKLELTVPVMNMLGNDVEKELKYIISDIDNEGVVYEGYFISPRLEIDADNVPSGRYNIEIYMPGDSIVEHQKCELIIQRENDTRPPFRTPLWVPANHITAKANAKSVEIRVGSSYNNSWILCEMMSNNGFVSREWIKINNRYKRIIVDVPGKDEILEVYFLTVRDGICYRESCTVYPHSIDDDLKIMTETFRDKIHSKGHETWKFRFEYAGEAAPFIPAMATMSDKALNALVPFRWHLTGRQKETYLNRWSMNFIHSDMTYCNIGNWHYIADNKCIEEPRLNLYCRCLYGYYPAISRGNNGLRILSFSSKDRVSAGGVFATSMDYAVAEESANADSEESNINAIEYRSTEYPTAFFYPWLTADEDGVVEVTFDVPDFNTTWQFQLLGYTDEIYAKVHVAEAVSSKPVMVNSNLPRFLHYGDCTTLQATIYNNSDLQKVISGHIELFNPLTEEILLKKEIEPLSMKPMGSRVVEIDLDVDEMMQFVGYRIYAISDNYSDGEQELIAILPSSSQVIESAPFYLGVGDKDFCYTFPNYADDATVTFSFCENPIWHCVTAMPEYQTPKSSNILSQTNAYFINCMAVGLLQEYPQIEDSIVEWEESADSILISNLQKNENLKNVVLENTPWLQDAKSETLRMHNLKSLFDLSKHETKITQLMGNILSLQSDDGGWSWCRSMHSSAYITSEILRRFAMLHQRGYLSDYQNIRTNIERALTYCDNSFADDYEKHKDYNLSSLLNYLYTRSCFSMQIKNKAFADLKNEAINRLKTKWEKLSKYDQATAAMLLQKEGFNKLSREILESLNQNALHSSERGMWFDNLYGSVDMLTTKQVLLAYDQIEPANQNIDKLRQWLIMQRQAQNWGDEDYTIEVIYAILSTGAEWLNMASESIIRIDDRVISPITCNTHTGAITLQLDADSVSGRTLSISRNATQPAWGSIINRETISTQDVEAAAIPDLSIEKKIYKVIDTDNGTQLIATDTLCAGDKVRVQLIIRCKKEMEYVAITDERAGCMSPIEQLSRYKYEDSIWAYREVRNSDCNMFIDYLPKGTHILTYDCYIIQAGRYSTGIVTIQSNYAPELTAHSVATALIVVKPVSEANGGQMGNRTTVDGWTVVYDFPSAPLDSSDPFASLTNNH